MSGVLRFKRQYIDVVARDVTFWPTRYCSKNYAHKH